MSLDNKMSRMYRMRKVHEDMQKSANTLHPVTGEEMDLGEHDRSLAEIFQDKKEEDFFLNHFLAERDSIRAGYIAEALADGKHLIPQEEAFLEKARVEYNMRRAEVTRVCEMLTPEEVENIAHTDPAIQQIVGKIGAEKAAELLSKQFENLGMSDSKSFKKMANNLREVQKMRTSKEAAEIDKNLQHELNKRGINEQKYFEATKSGLSSDTQENLRKLVAEDFGWFRKSIDFVSGYSLSGRGAKPLYENFEDQQALLNECDKHLKIAGKVLQGTLTPDVRLAMQKYMLEGGEIKDKKPENTISTIQDYRRLKKEADPSAAKIVERYQEYLAAEMKNRGIKDISKQPAALNEIKETFAKGEIKKRDESVGSGIFAALIAFLFSSPLRGAGAQTKDDIKKLLP